MADCAKILKTVYSEVPSFDILLPVLVNEGPSALRKQCKLTVGVPVKPMLAHPTKSIQDVLHRFENCAFTCEWKYDGERAQIHKLPDGTLQVFSRNQENMTAKYPDLVEKLQGVTDDTITSFVIDAEVVAWDVEKKVILPFQVLSTRKRKDVQTKDITVQVCLFGFDLLYLNGEVCFPLSSNTLAPEELKNTKSRTCKRRSCRDEKSFLASFILARVISNLQSLKTVLPSRRLNTFWRNRLQAIVKG